MSDHLKVVPLDAGNVQDIPAMLENLAAQIRAGEVGPFESGAGVLIGHDGDVVVLGWGRTDDIHSIGILHIGAAWLERNRAIR